MTRMMLFTLALTACTESRDPEAHHDWFGPTGPLDENVTEPVLFSDEPDSYAPTSGPDVATLDPLFQNFWRRYEPGANIPPGCSQWSHTNELPIEFWATVTLHPRYYYKGVGCDPGPNDFPDRNELNQRLDSEEKYYGNYFIEDASGGIFVQNDSKAARFQMGDRVRIRVRGVSERFDLKSIVSHDIVEIDRGPHPISWLHATATDCSGIPSGFDSSRRADLEALIDRDIECEYEDESLAGRVVRATGKVLTPPDTFGTFHIESEDGTIHQLSLDMELNRRQWAYPVGSWIEATGPVLNSFGHSIILMRVGQVRILD